MTTLWSRENPTLSLRDAPKKGNPELVGATFTVAHLLQNDPSPQPSPSRGEGDCYLVLRFYIYMTPTGSKVKKHKISLSPPREWVGVRGHSTTIIHIHRYFRIFVRQSPFLIFLNHNDSRRNQTSNRNIR